MSETYQLKTRSHELLKGIFIDVCESYTGLPQITKLERHLIPVPQLRRLQILGHDTYFIM